MVEYLYEFGPFQINTRERILLREGKRISLKPKVYETLIVLIRNSGRVLEKEEIMKQVWPDTFVEENNLTGNIFALRRAFGEHDYIETVPRRGYRFTPEVNQVRLSETPEMLAVSTNADLAASQAVASRHTLSDDRAPFTSRRGLQKRIPSTGMIFLIVFVTLAIAAGLFFYSRRT
ncbi:MAG TPA: transcriptional regulator, partial [Pyrinomonadaceae bacterium]